MKDRLPFAVLRCGPLASRRVAVQNVELAHELIGKLKSLRDERPSERDLGEYERKTNFFQRVLEEELARATVS